MGAGRLVTVRIWVLLGVAVAGAGVGFLLRPSDPASSRAGGRSGGVAGARPPGDAPASATDVPFDVPLDVRSAPASPQAQKSLAAFAVTQAARGRAAVAALVELLGRPDIDCGRRWQFSDGQLQEYPSMRAACLDALRQIDDPEATRALREWLDRTENAGEAHLAALALAERGETGFAPRLLSVAIGADGPLPAEMVRLAALSDPGGTSRRVAEAAPRGTEQRDPGVLAGALAVVRWAEAGPVARGLLEDPAVTARARLRYAHALLERTEPDALRLVCEALGRGALSQEQAVDLAERAIASRAFADDLRAAREGDATARGRAEARAAEARRLVELAARAGAEGTERLLSRLEAQMLRFG